MKDLKSFYNNRYNKFNQEAISIKKRLITLSLVRVVVFLATSIFIYFTFDNWQLSAIIAVVGIGIFLFLLNKYTDLKRQRSQKQNLAEINKNEIDFQKGNYLDKEAGSQFKNPEHYYSEDIDLFGKGSFFQFINRSEVDSGTVLLSKLLLANNIYDIDKRQQAIKELAHFTEWRQEFSASARMIEVETSSKSIVNWIENYDPFLKDNIKIFPLIFSILSLGVFGLIYLNILDLNFLLYWLIVGFAITGIYVKRINKLSNASDRARDTIRQFAVLLHKIEAVKFKSEILQHKQKKLQKDDTSASKLFNKFSTALDSLDNRNNFIYAIIGNGFFLTDLRNSYTVEKWIVENRTKLSDWFEIIAFFDAYISLGTFAFNHPEYSYPSLNEKVVINAENLGHPLLKIEKRIDNSIAIQPEEFFIITGANMAGKSTFLRTVSLFIVMANVGLPVCATRSKYSPIKLITSMRTSDSLKDESSYFFSELTRLKFIVDAINTEPYFIVLDEILKGTNSTDKAIGSKKFVEKLVAGNATGIIATHDLSLCEIEQELKDVKNYYFDAQIINDELFFDYKFKKGICQNMNASFLLHKMGIVE